MHTQSCTRPAHFSTEATGVRNALKVGFNMSFHSLPLRANFSCLLTKFTLSIVNSVIDLFNHGTDFGFEVISLWI